MPIYEYACTRCGAIEEVLQKVSDKPLVKCPQCSGKLRKLISNSAFHLKGSGWYVTDYAKKPSPAQASSEKQPQAKSAKANNSSGGKAAASESTN